LFLSARLGEGVGELARQMLMNDGCKLAIAAGIDDPDSPIGTDPIKVMEAIESVADTDHVLVMMDIGSALLSAETALDLLDPAMAAKVRCAPRRWSKGRWRPPSAPPPAPGSTKLSPMP
jgi:PTS hybrid protein